MSLLLIYLFIALAVSFLCSLLEATLLSIPRSYIAVLIEQGSHAGERLRRMKDDVDRPLAAILTLNTFAHTLGATGVGAEAALLWGDAWIGVISFVLTLIILIFSEIIPKTIGAVHAKRLAPFASSTIQVITVLFWPFVSACDWVSKLLSRRNQYVARISRDEVRSLARLALEEGAIDEMEAQLIRNLIALREITIRQVMTPRTVVYSLRADQTVQEALRDGPPRFARIPIVDQSLDDTKGFVHRYQLFAASDPARTTVGSLARPLHAVPSLANLLVVLQEFLRRKEQLFLVVDEYGGALGIVTLEDLLETLTGFEIVDETDSVEDLQLLARRLMAARSRGTS